MFNVAAVQHRPASQIMERPTHQILEEKHGKVTMEENQSQAEQLQKLAERSDRQAEQDEQLSTRVAQLKNLFDQATAAGKNGPRPSTAFNR